MKDESLGAGPLFFFHPSSFRRGDLMQAVRVHQFGGPEVLAVEEVPELEPGPGQILLQVKAVGVNPVETYIRAGTYAAKPPLPYTPGADAAGVVVKIGEGVGNRRAGERVYAAGTATGAYAQYALCAESQVYPLPERVTFEQGAAIGVPYGTAYRALFQRARVAPGEWVLIHGASGGVGIAAVQLARAAGLKVIGTGGTGEGRRLIEREGAHHVLDHGAPDYLEELMNITAGRGADVIVEMLANVNLGKDLGVVAKNGRIVIVGSRGPVEINPREAMTRDANVLGMTLFNVGPEDMVRIHAALYAGLDNSTLRPVIGRKYPLTEAAQAHRQVMEPGAYGKILLIP